MTTSQVDWYPWCSEAFEKAKREDKPIFLSVGYSTCHWCELHLGVCPVQDAFRELLEWTWDCPLLAWC